MAKKILITGSTGKIGQKLINCLKEQDLDIRGLKGNLLEPENLFQQVQDVEEIIHLAAITHSRNKELYWQVNVKGTENLIKVAQGAAVKRFIFISTRAIDPSGGAYSQSKLAAEEIVKNSGIDWLILRPAEVYGMAKGEMIDQIIKLVKKSFLIPIIDTKQYSLAPLYIDDLIDVLGKVIFREDLNNKTYILAGPESFSFRELVEQICQFYQLKRWKIYCPLFLIKILSLFGLLVSDQVSRLLSPKSADISLAKKDLDFNPLNFQKGLSLLK